MPIFAFLRRLLWTLSFRQHVSRNSGTTYALPLFSVCTQKIPYIVQTTVPSQQTLLDEKALQDWADETQWLGLDIVKAETLTKTQSAVEFKAHFQGSEQPQVHHEYSLL